MSDKDKIPYVHRGDMIEGLTIDEIKPDIPPPGPEPGHKIYDCVQIGDITEMRYEDLTNEMKFAFASTVTDRIGGTPSEFFVIDKRYRDGWLQLCYYNNQMGRRRIVTFERGKETVIKEAGGFITQ